jgi:hypothetical protein
MNTVSFTDYTPPARFDGVAWTIIKINESAVADGPWNLIDTQDITPVDTDPSHPAARSFTTDNATLVQGWYQILFEDPSGSFVASEPIQNLPEPQAEWMPTVQQVADMIISRTKDKYGNEVGTFNADTRPTDTQVIQLINIEADRVSDVIGDDIPQPLWDDAAGVVAERTAMQIELDYYSEQVNTGRSIYPQLKELYEEDLQRLSSQVSLMIQSGSTDKLVETGPTLQAVGTFPDSDQYPAYGYRTLW